MNNHNRKIWVDYLRTAITVLVVAHHSSLAYTTFARFDENVYINSTHPIVDSKRWVGMDIFENFNDVFFMSLMFFIGGLFLIKSINKKGVFVFVRDRFYRLFIPFLSLGTLFMLIAYFPSYYVANHDTDIIAYIKDFFTRERWPAGPPWFIWVLFLFNILFALFNSQLQKISKKLKDWISILKNKPFTFFVSIFFVTWVLYVPIAYMVGAGTWTGIGPFDFQLSRIILYFGYFIIGVFIGNTDFNNDVFSGKSTLVKKWWLWVLLALVTYTILTIIPKRLRYLINNNILDEFYVWMIYYTAYTASCTISCIGFITTFRKWVVREKNWMNSLTKNAYSIYLIHFIFVIWIQFLLLKFNISAFIKFIITFVLALILSWIASSFLRKIKIIKKYL